MDKRRVVEDFLRADEAGDIESRVAACAEEVVIYDAGQPPAVGRAAARALMTGFRDVTSRRTFEVLSVAEEGNVVYAWWQSHVDFRAGVTLGPVTTTRPFDVTVSGVHRFLFDATGHIRELDIAHETTSTIEGAVRAAR